MRNENFASEIFHHKPVYYYVASQKKFTQLCGLASKQRAINRFTGRHIDPYAGLVRRGADEFRIKKL